MECAIKALAWFRERFPELKKASFTGMEKYGARKLLRGLLSFPVHMEIHYVLATALDQNLSFRNSLSCVLGKGEGCVVYLCAVGMEEGEVGEHGEELCRCSLEPDCFLGLTQLPELSWDSEQLTWAEGTSKSPEIAPKWSQAGPPNTTGQLCVVMLDGWLQVHLFFRYMG